MVADRRKKVKPPGEKREVSVAFPGRVCYNRREKEGSTVDVLIVVDMQNDFVSGALGTPEAREIVPAVTRRVREGAGRGEEILFTRDTHGPDYLETQEGRKLPVPHCIRDTEGWEIIRELQPDAAGRVVIDKPTFGSSALGLLLAEYNRREAVERVSVIGLCTDICVISNALLVKAFLPEAEVTVDAACCAGVTPESHKTALAAMKTCQITVEHAPPLL